MQSVEISATAQRSEGPTRHQRLVISVYEVKGLKGKKNYRGAVKGALQRATALDAERGCFKITKK